MIPADLPVLVLSGALQGLALGAALVARMYVEPSLAVWAWPLTLLALVMGGTSGKRRKRYRYR